MCGIAGIRTIRGVGVDRDQLTAMIRVLAHRGPDGQGIYIADGTGLAHTRLSIIDLDGGRQPMSIANGKLWITFNGEIFNYVELRDELIKKGHTFSTHSDTEVILHLYEEDGENCVRRLNGQWAFGIWDEPKQRLFLSRDRMGVRPLFYTQTSDAFLFASEIKALLAHPQVPCELDLHALDQIFTFWVTLPPRTAFRSVSQLPPGHSLVLEDGRARLWEYWRLEYAPTGEGGAGGEDNLAEELLDLLRDATRIRLRADVPVGAYLSGGLDSTLITSLARGVVGDGLRSFSVSFDDPEYDESGYQKEATEFLHTQHSDVRCSYEAIAAVFPDVIWHAEQPIIRASPAPLFLLAKLVRSSGFKVVLTGEGADETMGGYDIFKEAKIRRFWGRNPASRWRPHLLKRLYPYMEGIQKQPPAYLQRFFCVTPENLASPFFSHLPRWELTEKLKAFLSRATRAEIQSYSGLSELENSLPASYRSWDVFNQAEYLEARYLLPGFILSSQGDRMAMAHAVEGRYPFLDHRVVEFGARLSPSLKMKVLDQKYLLKRVARGLVPKSIQRRHKQPYRAPDEKTFLGPARNYVDDMLSPENIKRSGVFDPESVAALALKLKSGHRRSAKDIMALLGILSTETLLRRFKSIRG